MVDRQDNNYAKLDFNCATWSTNLDSAAKISPAKLTTSEASQEQQLRDLSPSSDSLAGIEIEQILNWNHIKVPLIAKNQFSKANEPYWLVLATKIPSNLFSEFKSRDLKSFQDNLQFIIYHQS